MGQVPFGSGDQRFRKNYRHYFQPGPDKYMPKAITAPEISETVALKGTNYISVDATLAKRGVSPRGRGNLKHLNETGSFKSKVPKIGYMLAEDKRIRQLHGPKKDLKYQIKLNDVVLDKAEQRSRSTELENMESSKGGRIMRGSNYNDPAPVIPENKKQRNNDLFGLKG